MHSTRIAVLCVLVAVVFASTLSSAQCFGAPPKRINQFWDSNAAANSSSILRFGHQIFSHKVIVEFETGTARRIAPKLASSGSHRRITTFGWGILRYGRQSSADDVGVRRERQNHFRDHDIVPRCHAPRWCAILQPEHERIFDHLRKDSCS